MAGIFRGQGSAIARLLALLPALLFAVLTNPAALAQLSEQPLLVIDPGMHTAPIKAVDVDAAGRLAVTGSDDKTVRVWDLAAGKELAALPSPGQVNVVAFSPDGKSLAGGSQDGSVRIWAVPAAKGTAGQHLSGGGEKAAGLPPFRVRHRICFSRSQA